MTDFEPNNNQQGLPHSPATSPIRPDALSDIQEPSALSDTQEHQPPQRPKLLARRTLLKEVVETLLLIIAIYTLVNLATSRYVVDGQSMLPTFEGEEYLIVNRFEYMFNEPERGDIVVFHYPNDPTRDFIKRIVGLPGETVRMENGRVFVNDEPIDEPYILDFCNSSSCRYDEWVVGENEYFVLGDNRNSSQDSVRFGPIDKSFVVGRAWIKYWPPQEWDIIEHHTYGEAPFVPTVTPSPIPTEIPETTPVPPYYDSVGG